MQLLVEADDAITYVIADDHLTRQLLINLAVNAVEAFEGRLGTVTFRIVTDPVNGTVELYVEDNGPGVSNENLRRLYQPFFSTKRHGTGLGLAIVHRVAVAQKLKLSVDSQLDVGTTFMIEFRLCSGTSVPNADKGMPEPFSAPASSAP